LECANTCKVHKIGVFITLLITFALIAFS